MSLIVINVGQIRVMVIKQKYAIAENLKLKLTVHAPQALDANCPVH